MPEWWLCDLQVAGVRTACASAQGEHAPSGVASIDPLHSHQGYLHALFPPITEAPKLLVNMRAQMDANLDAGM